MKQKIKSYILKIKLLNRSNFNYFFFKFLFKITKINLFYIFALINDTRFKNIPSYYNYFESIYHSYNKSNDIFLNSNVLEIGGGEIWGMMPVAIKHRSLTYTNIDLLIKNNIINSKYLWKRYLRKVSKYISEEKIKKFKFSNLSIKIEELDQSFKYDTVISISCLEHIDDLQSFFFNIKKNTSSTTKHMHIVNFSNHLDKNQPFKHIYETNKNFFLDNYKVKINLLRINDYIKILKKNNYIFKIYVIKKNNLEKTQISDFWKSNYSFENLSVETAIIIIDGFSLKN